MQVQRHYSKAPIKEAIIDLRVTLPGDISVNKLADIHPYISDKFPIVQSVHRGVGSLAIQPGMSGEVNASEHHFGFWFRSEDNLRTFQATLEGFTFNRLAPYESWEEFSNDARSLWEIYKEICRPIHVTRAAIRYINQINIPANGLIELKDYLSTVPEVPSDLPEKILQTDLDHLTLGLLFVALVDQLPCFISYTCLKYFVLSMSELLKKLPYIFVVAIPNLLTK